MTTNILTAVLCNHFDILDEDMVQNDYRELSKINKTVNIKSSFPFYYKSWL